MIVSKFNRHAIGFASILLLWATNGLSKLGADQAESKVTLLPNHLGGVTNVSFPQEDGLKVLCFLGCECPIARLYGPRLQKLQQQYAKRNVVFVGINSNQQDSMRDVKSYCKELKIQFPITKDFDQTLAKQFKVSRTPEVILLDSAGNVVYRGRIDDQYLPGVAKPSPTREDLKLAIDAALDRKLPTVASTDPVGCLIGRARSRQVTTELTFCKDIVPILNRNCTECHRRGEIGPFSLTDFEGVSGWADMCVEVIDDGRMPPWHANPEVGSFKNERHMTKADKVVFKEWAQGGRPYGNPSDLPGEKKHVNKNAKLNSGGLLLKMRGKPFQVAAEGTIDYQYFVVDPNLTEDRWIKQVHVLPGNRSVVHHIIVFERPRGGTRTLTLGFLGAYVPGQRASSFPNGFARRIRAGSKLVFQVHYTPNGSLQDDLSAVRLEFTDPERVTHEVTTTIAINQEFEIPPKTANYSVSGRVRRMPETGFLLSITPHMHYRGKSFTVSTGGKKLLDVPRYDFNWQHVYELKSPLPLEELSGLDFVATFDNSAANPFNPNPNDFVRWGDQTDEEMAIAFFDIAIPRNKKENSKAKEVRRAKTSEDDHKKFFDRFDKDGDGFVARSEVPAAMERFYFGKVDADGNGKINQSELARYHINK